MGGIKCAGWLFSKGENCVNEGTTRAFAEGSELREFQKSASGVGCYKTSRDDIEEANCFEEAIN